MNKIKVENVNWKPFDFEQGYQTLGEIGTFVYKKNLGNVIYNWPEDYYAVYDDGKSTSIVEIPKDFKNPFISLEI